MSMFRRSLFVSASSEVGPECIFDNTIFYKYPLVYDNNAFRFQTSWNECNSFNSKSGLTNGSTFFSYDQVKNINLDGYRIPTENEIDKLYSSSRIGGTYSSVSGAKYSHVQIGSNRATIFFPDNCKIKGPALYINSNNYTTLSIEELASLTEQHIMCLGFNGYYNPNGSWSWLQWMGDNTTLEAWSSTYHSDNKRICLYISNSGTSTPYATINGYGSAYEYYCLNTILCKSV